LRVTVGGICGALSHPLLRGGITQLIDIKYFYLSLGFVCEGESIGFHVLCRFGQALRWPQTGPRLPCLIMWLMKFCDS